tara:strand:+ start:257 stop:463 length:207 start_codon:yes stop_codon:yes gene_type:complete
MSSKKQTAVEWLAIYLKDITSLNCDRVIEQAKEMEKQQIMDAYHINPLESKWENIAKKYYKETYEDNN